ncbi:MAG: sulfatase-like hydrolase/transferase [Myxococcota bacterium]
MIRSPIRPGPENPSALRRPCRGRCWIGAAAGLAVLLASGPSGAQLPGFGLAPGSTPTSGALSAPDVIIFLADDMGFSDLPGYGGEIDAPHLEALARDGARFSQFYATPRCSPTRAALLTGRSPHAAGVGWLADSPGEHEAYRGAIRQEVVTLPEALAPAGYHSYAVGKWHLDPALDAAGPDAPIARGFERYFGVLRGADDFYRPESLARDEARLPPPDDADFYLSDALAREAVESLRYHLEEERSKPFFLYVAFTAPHWPVQAPAPDIDAHAGRYREGWDAVRARRAERIRELGVLQSGWSLVPRDPYVPPWEDVEHPEWERARMRAYAGAVRAMDRAIHTVLSAVRDAGREDRTLVFFLSDNGGSPETLSRASRWLRRAGGFWMPEHYGDDPRVAPGGPESFQSYGRGWSNVSNAPFRGHKSGLLEGGIASPLIVRWPEGLAVPTGSWVREPAHVTDIPVTILDLAGVPAPRGLEGQSLAPVLAGRTRERRPMFWEHEGWAAVRDGDLKAVRPFRGDWSLYDLASDRSELKDLADARPDDLARLVAAWEVWAEGVGVQGWPWAVPVYRRAALVLGALALLLVGLLAGGAVLVVRRLRRPRPSHG